MMPRGRPKKDVTDIDDLPATDYVEATNLADRNPPVYLTDGDRNRLAKLREEVELAEKLSEVQLSLSDLIVSLAANPAVYQGTANDAAKIVKLAEQILAEVEKV